MPGPLAIVACSLLLAAPRAPTAKQVDEVVVTLHGEARHDEYAWLRAGGEDPAVRRHLAAENAYAAALMRPYAGLMRALAREIEAGTYVDHESVPVRRGAWLYWTRSERRRDLPLYLRRRVDAPGPGAQGGAPERVLDPEALARGEAFFDLELFELSDDGRYLAYSTDDIGAENYTLYIKDLETGALGPDRLQRVTSAAWSADGAELLYTVRDDVFRSYALYRHRRGETGPDPLVLREDDAKYELSVRRSRSGEWFILAADSYGASEARVARADGSFHEEPAWVTIAARRPGHLYDLDHAGDTFYVRSNYDTPNFRVMTAPEDDPRPARWRPLVPGRADVAITGVDAFAGKLVLSQRERGRPGLEIVDLATGGRTRVGEGADADVYTRGLVTITVGENPDPRAKQLRVYVESVQQPERTLDIDLADGRQTLLQQRPATRPCGGDGATIGAARAADGAEIQYLYFAGAGPVGPRPLLLEAYGAYGSVFDPDHEPTRCALLDRGVDFVIAWVRGGGELGEPWHDAARVRLRERSAGDLIAVAERLIAEGRTTAGQLVIAGESAGGGLMGAALNARPELFAGAVLRVPFLDAVGTMADASAPLTTIEYEEWGDPRVREDYDVMRRWCPYSNLGAREYPPVLVLSSLADSRVEYHEQARYVARARAQGRGGPFLLRTEMHGGHGGASSRRAFVEAQAFTAAFILRVGELRRRAR